MPKRAPDAAKRSDPPSAVDEIRDAALTVAHHAASVALAESLHSADLAKELAPADLTAAMLDPSNPRAEALAPYRLGWRLRVLELITEALVARRGRAAHTPDVIAIEEALAAGATWQQIGDATETPPTTAHTRYRRLRG
ncbi:hypothetical protein [Mycolicibacterium fortuitum]|uniref:hypothetical protein n=1 Tax=Mycolicibacterium fortuitum TaxID=1766 RepID=UPI0026199A4A|nr:hypothetical protein [Mycolicibacterium fortuitum]